MTRCCAAWRPPEEFDEYRIVRDARRGRDGPGLPRARHAARSSRRGEVHRRGRDSAGRPRAVPDRGARSSRASSIRTSSPSIASANSAGGRTWSRSSSTATSLDKIEKPLPWRRVCELGDRPGARPRGGAPARRPASRHQACERDRSRDDDEVKLLDFGLAKLVDTALGSGSGSSPRAPPSPAASRPRMVAIVAVNVDTRRCQPSTMRRRTSTRCPTARSPPTS